MIDKIKCRAEYSNFELFRDLPKSVELFRLTFYFRNGKYGQYYQADMHNKFRVKISRFGISWEGSLHTLYHGSNHGNFTFNEIQNCINRINKQFEGKFSMSKISQLEFGLNIIDSFWKDCLAYQYARSRPMFSGDYDYGHYFQTSELRIKSYNKTDQKILKNSKKIHEQLDRIEIAYKTIKKLNGVKYIPDKVKHIADLKYKTTYYHIFRIFKEELGKIIYQDSLPAKISEKQYTAYMIFTSEKHKKHFKKNHRERHDKLMAVYRRIRSKRSLNKNKLVEKQIDEKFQLLMKDESSLYIDGKTNKTRA